MKVIVQQEIMLLTSSFFLQHQLCDKDSDDNRQHANAEEKLEEACWNGMLCEWLPELMEKSTSGRPLFLWHISLGNCFLRIEMSETAPSFEAAYSIDSSSFLSITILN